MISMIEAASLLRQALRLQPGIPLSSTVINPTVSGAHERAQHQAGSIYVATHRLVDTPSMRQVAEMLNEPLFIQDTLGERALAEAQAVLRGRVLNVASCDYLFAGRRHSARVNEATVTAAVDLITDAITQQQQKVA
jgi:hypothetical protein